MASLEDLEDLENEQHDRKKDEDDKKKKEGGDGDNKMEVDDEPKMDDEDDIDPDVLSASTNDIINRRRLLENDLRVMKQEFQRLTHEKSSMKDKIKDNLEKIENNRCVLFEASYIYREEGYGADGLCVADSFRTSLAMSSSC